jgi:hypothetical protein
MDPRTSDAFSTGELSSIHGRLPCKNWKSVCPRSFETFPKYSLFYRLKKILFTSFNVKITSFIVAYSLNNFCYNPFSKYIGIKISFSIKIIYCVLKAGLTFIRSDVSVTGNI